MTEYFKEKVKIIAKNNSKKLLKMTKSILNKNTLSKNEVIKNNKMLTEYFTALYHILTFKLKTKITKIDFIDFGIKNKKELVYLKN